MKKGVIVLNWNDEIERLTQVVTEAALKAIPCLGADETKQIAIIRTSPIRYLRDNEVLTQDLGISTFGVLLADITHSLMRKGISITNQVRNRMSGKTEIEEDYIVLYRKVDQGETYSIVFAIRRVKHPNRFLARVKRVLECVW